MERRVESLESNLGSGSTGTALRGQGCLLKAQNQWWLLTGSMEWHSWKSETRINRFYFKKKKKIVLVSSSSPILTSLCLSIIQLLLSSVCWDLNCHFLVLWVVRIMRGILWLCFISGSLPSWGCVLPLLCSIKDTVTYEHCLCVALEPLQPEP